MRALIIATLIVTIVGVTAMTTTYLWSTYQEQKRKKGTDFLLSILAYIRLLGEKIKEQQNEQ